MKKVLAILFAMIFALATTVSRFAQAAPAARPAQKEGSCSLDGG